MAATFLIPFSAHNSVAIFGTVVDMDSPQRAVMSFLTGNKIQDGGRFEKKENLHNSAAV